jgi:asparagine synthase (glutamine-hydrolysing)
MEEVHGRALRGGAEAVREIDGSFAIVARSGKTVRLARSLDRPLRYFLAKREGGPVLITADRIDTIHQWLKAEKLDHQFHPI